MNISLIIRYLIVIAWMALIFAFSHQVSDVSTGQSSMAISAVRDTIGVEPSETFVRKSAHALVYFVLGVLLLWLVRGHSVPLRRAMIIAIAIALVYACSDELHQMFVPGRSAEIGDVLLDTAAAGLAIVSCGYLIRRK